LRSKTGTQDNTFVIGDTSKRRAWLQQVAAALHQNVKERVYLYNLAPGQLNRIYNRGATLAKVDEVNLHRLRHGGASADGIEQVPEPTIQSTGFWASVKSVQRYKKPGAYLRELSKLPAAQLAMAQALERTLAQRLCMVLLQSSSTSQRVSARGASSVLPRVSTITKGSLSKERENAPREGTNPMRRLLVLPSTVAQESVAQEAIQWLKKKKSARNAKRAAAEPVPTSARSAKRPAAELVWTSAKARKI
jgi:hypothetical protein